MKGIIRGVRLRRDVVGEKLADLIASDATNWKAERLSLEAAWQELKAAYQQAAVLLR